MMSTAVWSQSMVLRSALHLLLPARRPRHALTLPHPPPGGDNAMREPRCGPRWDLAPMPCCWGNPGARIRERSTAAQGRSGHTRYSEVPWCRRARDAVATLRHRPPRGALFTLMRADWDDDKWGALWKHLCHACVSPPLWTREYGGYRLRVLSVNWLRVLQ